MPNNAPTQHRRLTGKVVSDRMDKTVVVRVDRVTVHPKYHKQQIRSRRFQAHDPENKYHLGDRVTIEETRPLSANKRWQVISKQ